MHANSRLLFEKYAKKYFRPGIRVLEIGPDRFPSSYQLILGDSSMVWHTVDVCENPELTYRASSEYQFPIQSQSYDIVLSGQVIEHVRRIWVWMGEVARVCKVSGFVITINPVSWPYHEAPVDCWRAFPEGMKALYEDASLKVILSTWESLEANGYRRHIPGRSSANQNPLLRYAYSLLGIFGFPIECSYDTITVGQKVAGSVNNPLA